MKITVIIEGGCIQEVIGPEGITIVVHDYDVPEDWGDQETIKLDDVGDAYQELIFNP